MGTAQRRACTLARPGGTWQRVLRLRAWMILALLAVFFSAAKPVVQAENEPEDVINYAYSNWIGSGFYKVGDRTVYLLRGPFSWTLREVDSQKWGLELLLPATIGFHEYDGLDNVGTFTFVPGVQFSYPILENWWLKPFGQFGFGKDFSGGDIAWVYGAGIKSLATFEIKRSELDFGTGLTWADQNQAGGGSDSGFSMFEIGINSRWPTNITVLDRKSDLNLFFVITQFVNDLDFERAQKENKNIHRLYKFGIALSSAEKFPILGLFDLRGGGLDVTFGDGYFGIGLTTGFPF
ncbi:MAG: hypothetical protein JSW26_30080 [Desulfobacterales bacterium]|nr:MAG: hypothetical protein JSW26_30080 [Desulfobacterales bacterium]